MKEKESRSEQGKSEFRFVCSFFANFSYCLLARMPSLTVRIINGEKRRAIQTVKLYQADSKCHLITAVINLSESRAFFFRFSHSFATVLFSAAV